MTHYKYISKLRLQMEFCSDFFVVNDIDIHQLNLRPFKSFFLVENPFKKCVFLHFFFLAPMYKPLFYQPLPHDWNILRQFS
jgi:hypothetical protein